jgi:hypothetical protein
MPVDTCMCARAPQRPFETPHLLLFLIRAAYAGVWVPFFSLFSGTKACHTVLTCITVLSCMVLVPQGRDVVFLFLHMKNKVHLFPGKQALIALAKACGSTKLKHVLALFPGKQPLIALAKACGSTKLKHVLALKHAIALISRKCAPASETPLLAASRKRQRNSRIRTLKRVMSHDVQYPTASLAYVSIRQHTSAYGTWVMPFVKLFSSSPTQLLAEHS